MMAFQPPTLNLLHTLVRDCIVLSYDLGRRATEAVDS